MIFEESNKVFPPKVGDCDVITITAFIKRVQNPGGGKMNFADKDKKDQGYHDLIPIDNGMFMVLNTWKLYFALKEMDNKLDVGDSIEINHKSANEYIITKIG